MKVVIQSKSTFNVSELVSVSNIAYDSVTKIVTVTTGGQTFTYNLDYYTISILW